MLKLTADIDGELQFSRTFTRYTENLDDLRQLWPGVIPELRAIMREQFEGEGVGATGKWAGLAAGYKAWKARHYPGKPILQRSGRLLSSLTRNNGDSIVEPKSDSLVFGTRVPYAIHHQRGGGPLKRRKIFDLNQDQKNRLMKVIQRRLLQAGRDAGFTLG